MYDVIVIGAGAMGSAAAYHLAADGRRVLLLEQYEIGHGRGSSHGESRIFRFAYPEIDYARFAMQCKPMWRALEADAGEQLLRDTGGLDFADTPDGYAELDSVAASLAAAGGSFERLGAEALSRRFPQWRWSDGASGVVSPDAGVLDATRCVLAMTARAASRGANVREREPAREVRVNDGAVAVTTHTGVHRAKKLIVTAGAWVNRVTRQFGLELPVRVTQEQVVYFRPARNAAAFEAGAFPIWIHYRGAQHAFGFPIMGKPGAKIGFHHDERDVDPDGYTATPREDVTERLRAYVRRHVPDLDGDAFDATACLYTSTPDHNFIVDTVPGLPHVVVGSPCSGHGFKFAIGIGRALADLAMDGDTAMRIGHVRTLANLRAAA